MEGWKVLNISCHFLKSAVAFPDVKTNVKTIQNSELNIWFQSIRIQWQSIKCGVGLIWSVFPHPYCFHLIDITHIDTVPHILNMSDDITWQQQTTTTTDVDAGQN